MDKTIKLRTALLVTPLIAVFFWSLGHEQRNTFSAAQATDPSSAFSERYGAPTVLVQLPADAQLLPASGPTRTLRFRLTKASKGGVQTTYVPLADESSQWYISVDGSCYWCVLDR